MEEEITSISPEVLQSFEEFMEVEITSISPEVLQSFEEFFRVAEYLPELLGAIYFMSFIIVGGIVALAVLKGLNRGW